MQKMVPFLILMAVSLFAPALAQDGSWLFRFRAISIEPNEDTDTILDTGTSVAVDGAIVPEVDLSYYFNSRWSLEVIAATAEHDLTTRNGALGGANAGSVWLLPPTFTFQYHFLTPDRGADLYAGLGVNYTLFYSYDLSEDLAGLGLTDVDFSSSFGLAGNLGVNFKISERWVFNIDAKYIDIQTDATLETAGPDLDEISVDINPLVLGVGFGFRF